MSAKCSPSMVAKVSGCGTSVLLAMLSFGCVDVTPPWQQTMESRPDAKNAGMAPNGGPGSSDADAGPSGRADGQGADDTASLANGSGKAADASGAPDTVTTNDCRATDSGGSKGPTADGADARDSRSDATDDGPGCVLRQCDGITDGSICWRLGKLGATCATTCADRGGTSAAARGHIGTGAEGGSQAECQRLLSLLGIVSSVVTVSINSGLGCHVKLGVLWPYGWAASPAYDENASSPDVRIMCGCLL